MIRGSVDTISGKRVTGWIYSDAQKGPLSVEAVINDEVVGSAVADLPRADLAAAGFGDGKCGFELRFKNEVGELYIPFVQVRLAKTDLELRRWAAAGFRDYFAALHQRYPGAGRSASVYGGLWTDRTDASAVLKGRTDIGIVASDLAAQLARFIHDGVLLMNLDAQAAIPANGKGTKGAAGSAVAAAVFDRTVLNMLRAVLDDHPVAVQAAIVDVDESRFVQMSAIEELPSPAECLGLIVPMGERAASLDIVRAGHRFAEFLPNGLSRWSHAAALGDASALLSADWPIDRHQVAPGQAMLIGPGVLYRIRAAEGSCFRILVVPARLSLLRFYQRAPTGEVTHASGARIWI